MMCFSRWASAPLGGDIEEAARFGMAISSVTEGGGLVDAPADGWDVAADLPREPHPAARVRARLVLDRVDEPLDTLPKDRIAEIVEAGRGAVEQARRRTAWNGCDRS